jgi:hypothetical protein
MADVKDTGAAEYDSQTAVPFSVAPARSNLRTIVASIGEG